MSLLFACLVAGSGSLSLAQIRWDTATNGNWSDATRWDGGVVPGAGDTVIIDVAGTAYQVNLDTNATVASFSLDSSDATFLLSSRTFETTTDATLSDGTVNFFSSTWNTASALENGANFNLTALNTSNQSIVNGGFNNNAGGELLISAQQSSTNTTTRLTSNGDLNNAGTVALQAQQTTGTARAFLTIGSGSSLNNLAGGTIEARANSADNAGSYTISTDTLTNDGSIINNSTSTFLFDRNNADYTNASTISGVSGGLNFDDLGSFNNQASGTVSSGFGLTLRGQTIASSTVTNDGTINVTGGNLSLLDLQTITNNGTIDVANGNIGFSNYNTVDNFGTIQSAAGRTVGFSGGTYRHQSGGSLVGGDVLNFTNTTLNLQSDFTTDFPTWDPLESTCRHASLSIL